MIWMIKVSKVEQSKLQEKFRLESIANVLKWTIYNVCVFYMFEFDIHTYMSLQDYCMNYIKIIAVVLIFKMHNPVYWDRWAGC